MCLIKTTETKIIKYSSVSKELSTNKNETLLRAQHHSILIAAIESTEMQN